MSLRFNENHPDDHPRLNDRCCAVCAAPASGFGVVGQYKNKILWCCGEPECFEVAARTYEMSAKDFTTLDNAAALEGGNEAGQYLDEIGVFSLDELTETQWAEFCRRLVGGYREALRTTLREETPF